jgi:hypothetical protein
MKKLIFIPIYIGISFLFLPITLLAGNEHLPVGARSAGMAHSSVTLSDHWSLFHNQAGLGRLKEISAGVYYENRFLVNTLSTGSLALAMPTKSGTFGLSVYTFGLSNYRESKFGLAYGRMLGEKISAGLQLNYLSTLLPEAYGKYNGFTAELGLQALLTDKIILGAHIYNISRAKLTDKNGLEYVPTVIRIGMMYKVSSKVFITSEFQKDIDHPIVFRAGTEYQPNEKLFLRIGIASNPGNYSFGFGYKMKTISLDIAASYHQILGFTPQVGFNWNMIANNKKTTVYW